MRFFGLRQAATSWNSRFDCIRLVCFIVKIKNVGPFNWIICCFVINKRSIKNKFKDSWCPRVSLWIASLIKIARLNPVFIFRWFSLLVKAEKQVKRFFYSIHWGIVRAKERSQWQISFMLKLKLFQSTVAVFQRVGASATVIPFRLRATEVTHNPRF